MRSRKYPGLDPHRPHTSGASVPWSFKHPRFLSMATSAPTISKRPPLVFFSLFLVPIAHLALSQIRETVLTNANIVEISLQEGGYTA